MRGVGMGMLNFRNRVHKKADKHIEIGVTTPFPLPPLQHRQGGGVWYYDILVQHKRVTNMLNGMSAMIEEKNNWPVFQVDTNSDIVIEFNSIH